MPKESAIADPDTAREFAEFITDINYTHRQQAADKFGISTKQVTRWSKDPRVLLIARELRAERDEKISRRIDGELLRRIEDPVVLRELDVKTLLDIRKQILGPNVKEDDPDVDDADITAMLEENPALAALMVDALTPTSKKKAPAADGPDEG